ncbi:zinc ribbon domain-containing protein [Verrucomicrobiales bacterium]|nr:zinc ribbon domain-containing protein [Verrucomicrobiales bacterium]
MPNYDYQCKKCGHEFEAFQRMSADRLTDCPLEECDGEVKRLLGTGAGIIFKGSGFYETDYRSDSYNKAKKADSDASKKSSDSGKSKSDSGKKADKSTS